MGFGATVIFYIVLGLAVATAVFVAGSNEPPGRHAFRLITAVLFWPMYVPGLLAGQRPEDCHIPQAQPARDEMCATIAQVDAELQSALGGLDGWAEDVLARERDRIEELRAAWSVQAARVREMDRLLVLSPRDEHAPTGSSAPELLSAAGERYRRSEQARQRNIERLWQVRRRAYEDLMGTLAWVRELVSMIHLAKFTGAPASRAEELVAQIAAAVEGVSAVTWQDTLTAHTGSVGEYQAAGLQEQLTWDSSDASATSLPPT